MLMVSNSITQWLVKMPTELIESEQNSLELDLFVTKKTQIRKFFQHRFSMIVMYVCLAEDEGVSSMIFGTNKLSI